MRYEALKDTSLDIIKVENVSNVSEFKYSIEKINFGKKCHSENIIYIIKIFYNFIVKEIKLLNKNKNYIFYKNEINKELYSKLWWNINF